MDAFQPFQKYIFISVQTNLQDPEKECESLFIPFPSFWPIVSFVRSTITSLRSHSSLSLIPSNISTDPDTERQRHMKNREWRMRIMSKLYITNKFIFKQPKINNWLKYFKMSSDLPKSSIRRQNNSHQIIN